MANIHIANLFIVNTSSTKYRYSFEDSSKWLWYRTDKSERENSKYGYTSSKIVDHFRNTNSTDVKTAESLSKFLYFLYWIQLLLIILQYLWSLLFTVKEFTSYRDAILLRPLCTCPSLYGVLLPYL